MKEATSKPKPKRVDGQITGLAGELFVAAELLKRGLLVSVTFGNAKAIDLFAHNSETGRNFTIQVKSLRSPNFFLISKDKVKRDHVYVFVLLNKLDKAVEYFIVPGATLLDQSDRFTKYFVDPKMPGIHSNALAQEGFGNEWGVFFENA